MRTNMRVPGPELERQDGMAGVSDVGKQQGHNKSVTH